MKRLRVVPIDGDHNGTIEHSNRAHNVNPMLYVPPSLQARINGIVKDVTTVQYTLPPGEFPLTLPFLAEIEWIYLNPRHNDYDEQLNRWKAQEQIISSRVKNALDSPHLVKMITDYEEYCAIHQNFTVTGVHSHREQGKVKYRCTITKYPGKMQPMTCGNYSLGKTCVAQILTNYFWATSNVKRGHDDTIQGNQFRVQKHISGFGTQVVSKAVYCMDQRSLILYVLDLELNVYSREEKLNKSIKYWDDLFKEVIDFVNSHMNYDKEKTRDKWPIGKKDGGLVLACNKATQKRMNQCYYTIIIIHVISLCST
jgi:hypothetical protein